jgi:hypothetical protein
MGGWKVAGGECPFNGAGFGRLRGGERNRTGGLGRGRGDAVSLAWHGGGGRSPVWRRRCRHQAVAAVAFCYGRRRKIVEEWASCAIGPDVVGPDAEERKRSKLIRESWTGIDCYGELC